MKKVLVAILLCLLMIAVSVSAFAADVKPGDTITMSISITSAEGSTARVSLNTNGAPVSFVSSTADNHDGNTVAKIPSLSGRFSIMNMDGIATGPVGTVTLKVNADAAPGTYTVSPVGSLGAKSVSGSVTFTVVAPACEHTFDAGSVTTPADCENAGVKTYTCTKCGTTKTEAIPSLGHSYDDGVQTKAPTCKEEGVMTFTCANCNDSYTKPIAKSDKHTWDDGAVTKEMTCLVDGEKTFTCTVCGEKDVTAIKAPGKHTYDESKTDTEKDPTCTEPGKGSFTCTACGTKIDGGEIPALGHDEKETVTKEATCGAEGEKTITCSRCDYKKTEKIPATGKHTYETKVTTEATCGAEGVETTTCAVCGDSSTKKIPATGKHTYEEKVTKEPTCTEEGAKTSICSVCGDKVDGDKIAALGHDEKEAVTKEATCGADGEKTTTCSRCDYKKTEKIPATGKHTYEEKVTKEPTCTEKGEKTFTCSVCGDKYTEEIAAKGHTPGADLKEKKPTCTKPGYKYFTCTACGTEVKESDIPATGKHIFEVTEEVPATCEKDGKRVSKCTYEGCTKTQTEKLKKLGHKMGEWFIAKAPTCTEDGQEKRECLNGCGKTETRTLKAAHTWGEWDVNKEANNKTHVCNVCGKSETKSLSTRYYMTVCSYGIRFRDLQNPITKEWYMFTPIDLSVEGTQTIDLIAGNMHRIGTATVLVKDGKVTVTTNVNNYYTIAYEEEFLTIIPALADLTEVNFEKMTNYAYGEEISIEEALGGDTKVLLLMRNRAWYEDNAYGVKPFDGKGAEYNADVESLKELMD